jgi:pyridoxine 5-phosphate synthase
VTRLCVNVDHVATIRQARGGSEPDPVTAAALAEIAGAKGIVVHLRGDRRHIQDRDLEILRRTVKTHLNVEMAATEEMLAAAERIRPHQATLVPERAGEVTTEGGLDVAGQKKALSAAISQLKKAGIFVSIFIDPAEEQVVAAADLGADMVELNTDRYCKAETESEENAAFEALERAAGHAAGLGLRVAAGHGLNYRNVTRIADLPEVEELNIGHNIIARAVLVGMEMAVRDMLALMD